MIGKYCIIANKSYGLFCGVVTAWDPAAGVARVSDARHIAQWYGRAGGITSLAEHGICGARASEARIGAASAVAELTGVVNLFACSDVARDSLVAAGERA